MLFFRKYFPALFAIFLISVVARIPTLNRPLSKHHEFCTAVALRILQIWGEAGISTYRFNPVMNYPHQADKFINNYASGSGNIIDAEGNYYYVSHPPFAYYLPFVVFKILGIKPDVLAIQLLNMLIHFICGIGVFLILQNLTPAPYPPVAERGGRTTLSYRGITEGGGEPKINLPAFAGFVIYMFSPGTLWFHSNVYMADILVQLFFIYGVFFALKFSEAKNIKWLILLAIASFLMSYTSWLGLFFCATVLIMSVLKKDLLQATVVGVCCTVALLLTIFQYSQIAGWNALKHEWFARFSERSGWDVRGILVIFKNYLTSYLPLVVAIFALLIFSLKHFRYSLSKNVILFISLSFIPVLLLHIVLSNYSGHDFTTLYGGLFLSVIFGILVHFTITQHLPRPLSKGEGSPDLFTHIRESGVKHNLNLKWIAIGLVAFILLGLAQYYYINRLGEYSLKGDRYADFHDIGKSIAKQSSIDEVIFLIGLKPSPEIIFYGGRNIQQVQDENEATGFLKKYDRVKGVVFEAKGENRVSLRERINLGEPN